MNSLSKLIMQRRRWLNGSLFAKIYAMKNFTQLMQTEHSCMQIVAFMLQFMYYGLQLIMDWFAVSLFFIQFRVATDLCLGSSSSTGETNPIFGHGDLQAVSWVLQTFYMVVIVILSILSFSGMKPEQTVCPKSFWTNSLFWSHRFAFIIFGLLSYGTIILTSAYILMGGSLALKILMVRLDYNFSLQ